MEMIVADQIIMGLILDAGDAKQHIYQALSLAKDGKFSECDEQIELADSQDHLMTSITEINLIKEIIDLRRELQGEK